jgi:predicted acylesterase/phospholipase RssA
MTKVDLTPLKNKKFGLVLSGGVVKAASWHMGVAKALEDLGFNLVHNDTKEKTDLDISTYVGSSAGALACLYFTSGYGPMDVIESMVEKSSKNLKSISYKDMLSLKKPIKKPPSSNYYDPFEGWPIVLRKILSPVMRFDGLFTTQGLLEYIRRNVIKNKTFEEMKADFFVIATQLDHSRKVVFSKYNYPNPRHDNTISYYTGVSVEDAVAASMSVPPFYSPYPIKNNKTSQVDYYIDGEIRETLSTHVAVDNGCDVVISSWTHTPYHWHDEIGSLVNYGLPAICVQSIYLMIQKKIISHRASKSQASDILKSVAEYMDREKLDSKHKEQVIDIIERKLNYDKNVRFIDICPRHDQYKVFLSNSFSLDPKKASELVRAGYKRTIDVFKKLEKEL